jgi:hypothetical protein
LDLQSQNTEFQLTKRRHGRLIGKRRTFRANAIERQLHTLSLLFGCVLLFFNFVPRHANWMARGSFLTLCKTLLLPSFETFQPANNTLGRETGVLATRVMHNCSSNVSDGEFRGFAARRPTFGSASFAPSRRSGHTLTLTLLCPILPY